MLLQEVFFRRFGARLPSHLLKPNVFTLDKFEFPKESIWNFIQYDGITNGPDTNDYFFRYIEKKIFVEHVYELSANEGNPRRLGVPMMPLVRQFHMLNKRFRLSTNIAEHPSDPNTMAVVNYSLINKAYRYPRSIYSEYYKWKNTETTIWAKMKEVAMHSNRVQYYFMHLPKTLPSLARLNLACVKFNQTTLNLFNSREALFLIEIWKWLSQEWRSSSCIGEWEQQAYNKVNIVIEDNGSWMMFNLGLLNQWRFINGVSDPKQKVQISPVQMQKRFLRALMFLMSYRLGQDETTINDSDAVQEGSVGDDDSGYTANRTRPTAHDSEQAEGTITDEYEKLLENLDKDLEQLDIIEKETADLDRSDVPEEVLKSDVIVPSEKDEEIKKKAEAEKLKSSTIKKNLFGKDQSAEPDVDVSFHVFETHTDTIEAVKEKINTLADEGLIDGSEYRRKTKLLERYSALESPEPGVKLVDYVRYDPDQLKIKDEALDKDMPDIGAVFDKSMLKSSLLHFDKQYIQNTLQKDIVGSALATQKAGFIVTDYEVEPIEDAIGKYDVHTMRVNMVEGQPSTLRFRLPAVDDNGHYEIGGTKYVMRKQRVDLPIRKISPTRVALTSYYGKTFVMRSEKRVNNYGLWLHNKISALSLQDDAPVTALHPSNVFDHEFKAPKTYTSLATYIKSFKYKAYEITFDWKEREQMFGEALLSKYEKNGSVLFGSRPDGAALLMDKNSTVYEVLNGDITPLGSLEDFLEIDATSAPLEFCEARIFGKNIPVGVILGYKLGLSKLIEKLNADVRRVPVGQRLNLQSHEYAIAFSDETLIFSKDDAIASLVLSGFKPYEKTTKNYSVYTFDKTGVYLKLLEQTNMSVRYLREIDLLDEMFVDPITEQILKEMDEPTTYRGLLVRSCEILMADYHKDPLDMQEMRIRGYERFAGAVYTEIVNALREQRASPNKKNSAVELNPYAVWKRVIQDPSSLPVNDLNPIQYLKEVEAVTYGGTGGRNSRSMVKSSRAFHKNDVGVISEATSDSSDVAVNTYMVANPKFTSVRGITKQSSLDVVEPTSLVSTSALLSVGGDQDSAQRLNMVSIQQSHTITCNGYKASPVRTGYEYVMAQRVGDSFARVAEKSGKVTAVSDTSITVQYDDGIVANFLIGRKFGKSGNLTIPHELRSDVKVGDKLAKGDVVTYNEGFFERDRFNPKNVIWKNNVLARVVLMESRQTHEDASSISIELARKLSTKLTKVKDVVITFDQQVRSVMQIGEETSNDSVLCIIENSLTAGGNLFDEDSLNTLKNLSNQTPMAKAEGIIEKIEVFYHGDIEDMSSTLQELATASDRRMKRYAKDQGKKAFTGRIDESFRINGEPLQLDSLVIRFYITSDVPSGIGDKGVFANQLKTIFSEVMDYDMITESGLKIDAVFGAQSIFNRIVNSAFVIGTTNTLLGVIGKKAAQIYKGS